MLDKVRRYAGSWGIKVVYFLVAVSFFIGFGILSSVRSCIEGGGGVVAVVDGETISVRKFSRYFYRYMEQVQKNREDKISAEEMEKLKDYVINVLINRILLKHYAIEAGIKVRDEEVANFIATRFNFYTEDGRFDRRRYEMILRENRLWRDEFEEEMREELFIKKLDEFLLTSLTPTDAELWMFYKRESEFVNIEFVVFDPENFKDRVHVSDKELKIFFDSHIENYKYGKRYVVKYVKFSPESYANKIELNEEKIRKYYEKNYSRYEENFEAVKERVKEDFLREEKMRLSSEDAVKGRTLMEEGKTLEEVAEKFRLKVQYTPPFEIPARGEIPGIKDSVSFSEKFRDLQEGDKAPLFQIGEEHFLALVDHILPEEIASFDDVKEQVKRDYIKERAASYAEKEANEFINYSSVHGLQEALKKFNLKPRETGDFSIDTMSIPEIGISQEILKRSFELNQKKKVDSTPYNINGKYYVIWLKDRITASMLDFEKKKSEFRKKLLEYKLNMVHTTLLVKLREKFPFRIYSDAIKKIS